MMDFWKLGKMTAIGRNWLHQWNFQSLGRVEAHSQSCVNLVYRYWVGCSFQGVLDKTPKPWFADWTKVLYHCSSDRVV